jgi:hypothetical protein
VLPVPAHYVILSKAITFWIVTELAPSAGCLSRDQVKFWALLGPTVLESLQRSRCWLASSNLIWDVSRYIQYLLLLDFFFISVGSKLFCFKKVLFLFYGPCKDDILPLQFCRTHLIGRKSLHTFVGLNFRTTSLAYWRIT